VTVDAATPADPGALGGVAECAKVNGLGIVTVLCAWRGDGALLAFLFSGLTPDKATQLFATVLPAIATRS